MNHLPARFLCTALALSILSLSLTGCMGKTPAAGNGSSNPATAALSSGIRSSLESSPEQSASTPPGTSSSPSGTSSAEGRTSSPGAGGPSSPGGSSSNKPGGNVATVSSKASNPGQPNGSIAGTGSTGSRPAETGKPSSSSSQKPSSSSSAPAKPAEPELSPDQKDRKKILTPNLWGKQGNVLILGNSFIATSKVGDTLRRLASENGQKLTVKDISEGNATIESLSAHIDRDPNIRAGKYDAIFLCGIFSPQTQALQRFLSAVKGTKTKIILFPASNESPSDIANARAMYPGSGYLGWLDIVYELYAREGFNRMNLVFDDWVLHLNEIGGYAGAQMIFHYLYRKTPVSTKTDNYISSVYGASIFGSSQTSKQKLATIARVAQELVLGTRLYQGAATV